MWTQLLRIFAIIAAVLYALRFLGKLFGKPTQQTKSGSRRREKTQKMVKDPVCGMYLDPGLAIRLAQREGELYFCSEECRQKYLKAG
jgi:YHS domain-containing protein